MVMLKYCFAASDDGKEAPVYSRVPNKHVDVYSFSAKVTRPTAKSDELHNGFLPLICGHIKNFSKLKRPPSFGGLLN